ncbi:uncharacterized protein LOC125423151 [Ziziphus jujuba]|uniref:Uncharacterized protein LOC125423151 n=1 Tax=Ziziphus jujuba TaxID=326968 RepID=A0ABM4A3G5_ZIZJJ|nr:uncharacterized protein LOC125423151 [Ziziphus jujuba]
MESFRKAKKVRLRNRHGKYMVAKDNESSVVLDRNGLLERAKWTVEFVKGSNSVRLKSCYNKYLTISCDRLAPLSKGRKVEQTSLSFDDPYVQWQPIQDGEHIKLKSQQGFLRGYTGWYRLLRDKIGDYTSDETQRSDLRWKVETAESLEGHEDTRTPEATLVPTRGQTTAQAEEASRQKKLQLGIRATGVAVGAAGVGVSVAALVKGDASREEGGPVNGDAGEEEQAGMADAVGVEDVDAGDGDW